MLTAESSTRAVAIASGAIMAGVFVADALTPVGVAVWLLYLVPVLLAIRAQSQRLPIALALACTVLIALGFVLSPRETPAAVTPLYNRATETFTIWLVAALLVAVKRAQAEARAATGDLEQRVRERTAELELANRDLAAFNSAVSHDLQAPLRRLEGFAALLEQEHAARLGDEGHRLVERLRGNVRRMRQLIEGLLQLYGIGRAEVRLWPTDLTAIARATAQEVRATAAGPPARISVDELPTAPGDPVLLRQLFVNLLANAVKFTSRTPEPRVHVTSGRAGEDWVVCVRDNGVGFPPEAAESIFEIFRRGHTDAEFEGTGIGLSIARRIVTRHGGRIWAERTPGGGATFCFTLPGATPPGGSTSSQVACNGA